MEILESMDVESIAQLIQVIFSLGISLISSTVSLVLYCLGAWGLFTIAKRRNLPKPWLAWIPVGNSWILGSIADQYQERVNGKKTVKRKWLVGLELGLLAALGMIVAACVLLFFLAFLSGLFGLASWVALVLVFVFLLCISVIYMLIWAVAVAGSVFAYMAYYDLFRSCKPNLAVLFLVLSILLGNFVNIAVLIFRNSDEGMPVEQYLPEAPQEEV